MQPRTVGHKHGLSYKKLLTVSQSVSQSVSLHPLGRMRCRVQPDPPGGAAGGSAGEGAPCVATHNTPTHHTQGRGPHLRNLRF